MAFRYLVLGAGRQGTAAAYDLARFGQAISVMLADADLDLAQASAARVNELVGRNTACPVQLDVRDSHRLIELGTESDVCLSAVPYYFNLDIARAAIAAKCSMCDLGGNTQIVREELLLDAAARATQITIVPDCGVGPGMIANLAVYAMERLDAAQEVLIYDGGLPQRPRPPFNYVLFFNIAGLTNEYAGEALYLKNGAPTPVKCFDEEEFETIDIPPLGRLEAFVTAGGLSTMVHTYEGKLLTLKNKTLRYPGHYAFFKGLSDAGMLDQNPVRVGKESIEPREFLHTLLAPRLAPVPDDRDLMMIHILARGEKGGKRARVTLDLLDRYDEATGFAAMERTTGFHLAIVAAMIARGELAPGVIPLERAVNASRMVEELSLRHMETHVSVEQDI